MLHRVIIILSIGLLSCKESSNPDKKVEETVTQIRDTTNGVLHQDTSLPQKARQQQLENTVGEKIQGDFDGDGKTEFASAIKIKEGHGNPIEDGTPDEYAIKFSAKKLGIINVGCCDTWLINEGDLNNNGTDDISVFQAPMNGCTYEMKTYSYVNNRWVEIVKMFLVPTACEGFTYDDLQKRIFKENDAIYYYETDPNDWSLVKVKAFAK